MAGAHAGRRRRSARRSTRSPPSSIRSAAASPATACGRRSAFSAGISASDVREVPTGTQVFDWTCRASGRSATPTSRMRPASAWSISRRIRPACAELQRAGARDAAARRAESAHPHPSGSARSDPLPHLVLCRALGFLHGQTGLQALPQGDYEVVIDAAFQRRQSDLWRVSASRRRARTNCCFRRISAIPRSPTTIAPAWRC